MKLRKQPERKYPDWSDCGQVYFTGGKGFGLTDELQTIDLGSEESIKKFLQAGEMPEDATPLQRIVLRQIAEYRRELYGIGEDDLVGAGVNGTSGGGNQKPNAVSPKRKRAALRLPNQKHKTLLHRRHRGVS